MRGDQISIAKVGGSRKQRPIAGTGIDVVRRTLTPFAAFP